MTPAEAEIVAKIVRVRDRKVIFDFHIAVLYAVPTKVLLQAVRRNSRRFPPDFLFRLTEHELTNLRSQIVTSSSGWGGIRRPPFAFTEQGVAMLSSVLRSPRAIAVNIAIMRAFVRLREIVHASKELSSKLDQLERRVAGHDDAITGIVRTIRQLALPPEEKPRRRIGF